MAPCEGSHFRDRLYRPGLIIQLSFIKGMRLVAAANRTIHKAVAAIELMKEALKRRFASMPLS
jgi:predicted homoserine dehydrogenase-like protein